MYQKENKEMEKNICHLSTKLDRLIDNNIENLQNEAVLKISQKLDNLIVNYMKKSWQLFN